ncbi:MAG: hypothetical protein KJO54_10275 [Gammaproteobacteria bacterium]|nr:hypothetical protein [Gammaproteobacteria bacterium]NNF61863.1 hypothetical protein [Gammaproteobacteria bacterium]
MTRYTHSILFFFAIALALLCSSVLMLYLQRVWDGASFGALTGTALVVAVLPPLAGSLASLRLVRWQQPATAWAVCFGVLVIITGAVASRLF